MCFYPLLSLWWSYGKQQCETELAADTVLWFFLSPCFYVCSQIQWKVWNARRSVCLLETELLFGFEGRFKVLTPKLESVLCMNLSCWKDDGDKWGNGSWGCGWQVAGQGQASTFAAYWVNYSTLLLRPIIDSSTGKPKNFTGNSKPHRLDDGIISKWLVLMCSFHLVGLDQEPRNR